MSVDTSTTADRCVAAESKSLAAVHAALERAPKYHATYRPQRQRDHDAHDRARGEVVLVAVVLALVILCLGLGLPVMVWRETAQRKPAEVP